MTDTEPEEQSANDYIAAISAGSHAYPEIQARLAKFEFRTRVKASEVQGIYSSLGVSLGQIDEMIGDEELERAAETDKTLASLPVEASMTMRARPFVDAIGQFLDEIWTDTASKLPGLLTPEAVIRRNAELSDKHLAYALQKAAETEQVLIDTQRIVGEEIAKFTSKLSGAAGLVVLTDLEAKAKESSQESHWWLAASVGAAVIAITVGMLLALEGDPDNWKSKLSQSGLVFTLGAFAVWFGGRSGQARDDSRHQSELVERGRIIELATKDDGSNAKLNEFMIANVTGPDRARLRSQRGDGGPSFFRPRPKTE